MECENQGIQSASLSFLSPRTGDADVDQTHRHNSFTSSNQKLRRAVLVLPQTTHWGGPIYAYWLGMVHAKINGAIKNAQLCATLNALILYSRQAEPQALHT